MYSNRNIQIWVNIKMLLVQKSIKFVKTTNKIFKECYQNTLVQKILQSNGHFLHVSIKHDSEGTLNVSAYLSM